MRRASPKLDFDAPVSIVGNPFGQGLQGGLLAAATNKDFFAVHCLELVEAQHTVITKWRRHHQHLREADPTRWREFVLAAFETFPGRELFYLFPFATPVELERALLDLF